MAAPLVDSTPAFVEDAYRKMERRLQAARDRLARPLTYAEKVLLGHLDDPAEAELLPGESYLNLRPDRVGLQDVTGQMAILQFMQAGKTAAAVPTTPLPRTTARIPLRRLPMSPAPPARLPSYAAGRQI